MQRFKKQAAFGTRLGLFPGSVKLRSVSHYSFLVIPAPYTPRAIHNDDCGNAQFQSVHCRLIQKHKSDVAFRTKDQSLPPARSHGSDANLTQAPGK